MSDIHTLPPEMLEKILSTVSVKDAQSLSASAPFGEAGDRIRAACTDRLCTAKYLRDNFGHGVELLEAMSKHRVYISGSRSLEFFVPGSIDSASDWDFYIPRHDHIVCSFMFALMKMGVTWVTPLEKLEDCYRAGEGMVKFSHLQYTQDLKNGRFQQLASRYRHLPKLHLVLPGALELDDSDNSDSSDGLDGSNQEMPQLLEPNYPYYLVRVTDDGLESSTPPWGFDAQDEETPYHDMDIGCVMNGSIERPEGKVKVQLITGGERSTRDIMTCRSVLRFHSSCVQSVIGPHLSCHLYGSMVFDKLSIGWRINEGRSLRAQQKYRDRGYHYVNRDSESFCLRSAGDPQSTLIPRQKPTEAPETVVKLYQDSLKVMSWQEYAHDIIAIPSTTRRHKLYGIALRENWFVERCTLEAYTALKTHAFIPCLW